MLRVISGKYRSRQLKEVKTDSTRPTTDKNKEVLFNSLGQFFSGGRVLDLFSGSGALGIEALSRGFHVLDSVENNFKAIRTIKDNIASLKIEEETNVYKADVFQFLKTTESKYDLILADPPYKLNRYNDILELISSRQLLNIGGIIVLESENSLDLPEAYNDLITYKVKTLGYSKFTFYRRGE